MRIGEVYYVEFEGNGSVQRGWRPGLILQNNVGNAHSPNTIVLPMTGVHKKMKLPTHVFVPASVGLKIDSVVLCENPQCVSKDRIGEYMTVLPKAYMKKIAESTLLASSVIAYLDPDVLVEIWKKAVRLNSDNAVKEAAGGSHV